MSLFDAVNNTSKTRNGDAAFKSTQSACLDLFSSVGAARGRNLTELSTRAFQENADIAMRIMLWSRDVRGGAGERTHVIKFIHNLITSKNLPLAERMLMRLPELGYWKDLLTFLKTPARDFVIEMIAKALVEENALCAKWMPRKGEYASILRKSFKLNHKQYRKMLVGLTNVVETKMCAKDWNSIDFGKIPSLASSRYVTAFHRNANEAYQEYKDALVKGTAKINAGAVYPYDILKSWKRNGQDIIADSQWKALPDYCEGSDVKILPVIDVSGSMSASAGSNVSCMDVAISLGLYIAQRITGEFHNTFISFSESPRMHKLDDSLTLGQKFNKIMRSDWGYNTNLRAVFELILKSAISHNLSQDQMPDKVAILTDMQFDQGLSDSKTAHRSVVEMFAKAGYKCPEIIYWNLRDYGNKPVLKNEPGVALVSGFSPSLMKTILSGNQVSPWETMLEVVNVPRYNY